MDFATMWLQIQAGAANLVLQWGWIPVTLFVSAIIMIIFIVVVVLFTANETDTVARRKKAQYVCRLTKVR